jgi:hypothetical protein
LGIRLAALLVIALHAPSCLGRDEAEHEITQPGDLLAEGGTLREAGWARRQLLRYDRALVAEPGRLREWDFFTLMDDEVVVNISVSNLGILSIVTVALIDLRDQTTYSAAYLPAAADRFDLSSAASGDTQVTRAQDGRAVVDFRTTPGERSLRFDLPESLLGAAARGDLTLFQDPGSDYLSLATPFAEDPHGFFFEQKIPGMKVAGVITVGPVEHAFVPARSYAVMDWGRGVWPHEVLWRWGGGFQDAGGRSVAFNLGNGFGDMRRASENLFLAGGRGYKLGPVDWTYDAAHPLAPWTFADRAGRLALRLTPLYHEPGGFSLGGAYSQQIDKVYGHYSGTVILSDGSRLELHDVLGFAEEVQLRW